MIVDSQVVPALVRHLKSPPPLVAGDSSPIPFEHEVEKGCALALGLLAVVVINFAHSLSLSSKFNTFFSWLMQSVLSYAFLVLSNNGKLRLAIY